MAKWGVVLAALIACGGTDVRRPVATNTADDRPLPLSPEIRTGTLPNGLTYYVLPHQTPAHRAYAWLAINAGSVQEDDDQRGVAHFDEHLAFRGTKRFPHSAIEDYFERVGMGNDTHVNAGTSRDQTIYQLEVPTDDPSYLTTGLDVLRRLGRRHHVRSG